MYIIPGLLWKQQNGGSTDEAGRRYISMVNDSGVLEECPYTRTSMYFVVSNYAE